jgi:hypothetical protein
MRFPRLEFHIRVLTPQLIFHVVIGGDKYPDCQARIFEPTTLEPTGSACRMTGCLM